MAGGGVPVVGVCARGELGAAAPGMLTTIDAPSGRAWWPLARARGPDAVEVMMMGKVERDLFYIHFSKPLTVLMALGIALSSFHKKYLVK